MADAGADRAHDAHEQRQLGGPARRPVDQQGCGAGGVVHSPHPQFDDARPGRDGRVGHDDGVVVERVVVEHQSVVLHEEAEARVLGPGREQDPVLAGLANDRRGHVEVAPSDRCAGLGRHRPRRRAVDVASALGMRGQRPEPHPEQLDQSVVEGEDPVRPGLGPPQLDQLAQQLRALGGQVVALGRIGEQVVELPGFGVVVGALVVLADRLGQLPVGSAADDRPAAGHLEVLDGVGRG